MQTLAFDGRTGASGDMLLGALLAAGADVDVLAPVADALPIEYHLSETTKNGVHATAVDVQSTPGGADTDSTATTEMDSQTDTDHSHSDRAAGSHGPHRTVRECQRLIEEMDLPTTVQADAMAIFRLLGEAEARVHGTDLADTHFHEVGADDAIADIAGVALLVDDLDVDHVVTTPIATGGGEVTMSHGTYPVPPPAVINIAEAADWELYGGPVETELLTPTGAAILAHFADGVESFPPLRVETSGYGAGSKSFDTYPNVLRATIGETQRGLVRDDVRLLETNIDDATPETLGSLQTHLIEAGARDVTILPATMKKSRPGHVVKVVVDPADVQSVAHRLATATGTLGIRETAVSHRWIADRDIETVTIDVAGESYSIPVKVARDADGTVYDVSTEYDDAEAVAAQAEIPVREVVTRAEAVYLTGPDHS